LSDALGLKEEQISFWFRNRRKQAKVCMAFVPSEKNVDRERSWM
jgi:hypothetical protein